MSRLGCCADGNLTAAATWGLMDTTSASISQANNTALTTSYVASQAFTPGAITIDEIIVFIASRAASPTGTMSVHLAIAGVEVAGTLVTVNVSDLPTCSASTATTSPDRLGEGGPVALKLAAPVLLLAATNYTVEAKTSNASQVNLYRDGTAGNWSRLLRTTTTQAPAAGDDMLITKEWTAAATGTARVVTMNSTGTTDYGSNTTSQVTPAIAISQGGTLAYGTAAATNYILRVSGYIVVYNGGTFNIGTPGGGEIPRDSTAELQFDCGADGDFGVVQRNGSAATLQGLSRTSGKNITWTKLNANMAVAATAATVVDDTGWKNGDEVAFSPTSQTYTDGDRVTLNADATATGLAWTGGTTFAHRGTAPIRGEALLLTRNVTVRGVTSGLVTFWFVGGSSTFDADWTAFKYFAQNASGKRGVNWDNQAGGTCSLEYCAFVDTETCGVTITQNVANTLTVNQCTAYNINDTGNGIVRFEVTGTATYVVTNNCFASVNANGSPAITHGSSGSTIGTLTGNCFSGTFSLAINLNGTSPTITAALWDNNEIHSCRRSMEWSIGSPSVISRFTVWHISSTTGAGIFLADAGFCDFVSCKFYGNATSNVQGPNTTQRVGMWRFFDCEFAGTTSFATTSNFLFGSQQVVTGRIEFHNCLFSQAAGELVVATNDVKFTSVVQFAPCYADNCKFGGTNITATFPTNIGNEDYVFLASQRHNQVDADHRKYFMNGTIQTNASVFDGTAPSAELKPSSASVKLKLPLPKPPVNDGATPTFTVSVRKSAAFNGNAPRFMVKRKDSIGISADAVGDTLSVGADTWEDLVYTMSAALDNGLIELYVDCDGTAGSVYVDNLRVS